MAFDPAKFLRTQPKKQTPPTQSATTHQNDSNDSDTSNDSEDDQPEPKPKTHQIHPALAKLEQQSFDDNDSQTPQPNTLSQKDDKPSGQESSNNDSQESTKTTDTDSPNKPQTQNPKTQDSTPNSTQEPETKPEPKPEAPTPASQSTSPENQTQQDNSKPADPTEQTQPTQNPTSPTQPPQASDVNEPFTLHKSEFFQFPIGMVRKDNRWYFKIKDLFDIIDIIDKERYITQLRNDPELSENWSNLVETISFIDQEKKESGKEYFASKDGVITLIRHIDKKFPGPFVRWINKVVKLKKVGTTPPANPNANVAPNMG